MSGAKLRMARAGKTFFFATRWLHRSVVDDTIAVYNFCRTVDDIADAEPAHQDRNEQLLALIESLRSDIHKHESVEPLRALLTRFPEIRAPLIALVKGCLEDLPSLKITTERDLARYAHGVAGNVGLVMYPILGGTIPMGKTHAASLGIAMQYTNIARDILEDLSRNRVYLPSTWLADINTSHSNLNLKTHEPVIVCAVQRLLKKAQQYYEYGLSGLGYLDHRNRFAIKVAARCYEAIGKRVIQNDTLVRERVVVPFATKALMALSIAVSDTFSSGLKGRLPSLSSVSIGEAPVLAVEDKAQSIISAHIGALAHASSVDKGLEGMPLEQNVGTH